MGKFVQSISLLFALGGALLVAVICAWRDVPPVALATRAVVVGAVVFAFARVAGELGGRAVLRQVAEDELAREEKLNQKRAAEAESAIHRKAA
jgi:hypothetical protein